MQKISFSKKIVLGFWSLIIISLVIYLVKISIPARNRYISLQERIRKLDVKIYTEQQKQKELLAEKYALRHDPVYIERVLRRDFGQQKEGEILIEEVKKHVRSP